MRAFIQICGGLAIMIAAVYPAINKAERDSDFGPDLASLPYIPGECNYKSPDLGYRNAYKPQIENLKWGEKVIEIRALRYESITDTIEKTLGLPSKFLLALIMHESACNQFATNDKSTASGLGQITAPTAKQYGLKVISESEIENFLERENYNELINADDRFHVVKVFDAVGRMISCGTTVPPLPDPRNKGLVKMGPHEMSYWVYRSNAKLSFPKDDWNWIIHKMYQLNNFEVRDKLAQKFNSKNPKLRIDGKFATFHDYLKSAEKEWEYNYDFERYEKMLSQE